LLSAWVKQSGKSALVVRNLALRWIPSAPRWASIRTSACSTQPRPATTSSRATAVEAGYPPPPLAIEVVSPSHPYKDYVEIQDRYAACGVGELWVLDPELRGPKSFGGPHALQLWKAQLGGGFARAYAGNVPARRTCSVRAQRARRAGRPERRSRGNPALGHRRRARASRERARASAQREPGAARGGARGRARRKG